MLPEVFSESFTRIVDIHDHYTRVSKGLSVSYARTNYRRFSIYCSGPKIWNAIPTSIQSLPTYSQFKKHWRDHLNLRERDWMHLHCSLFVFPICRYLIGLYVLLNVELSSSSVLSACSVSIQPTSSWAIGWALPSGATAPSGSSPFLVDTKKCASDNFLFKCDTLICFSDSMNKLSS